MNILIKIICIKKQNSYKNSIFANTKKKGIKANMEIFYEKFQTIINRRSSAKQARAL